MSLGNLILRDAAIDDVDALADFAIAMAWETEHKHLDEATVRRGIAVVINEPIRGRYFIAERAGERVGTLMLTYEWSDWRCADWWWIQSVYIVESARRSGVFRALYQHVLALSKAASGVCGLRLYVERDNQRAQTTYTALGMQDASYLVFEQGLPWLAEVVRKSD